MQGVHLFESLLRLSLPLIFVAYGALFCEKSGVANIALEGYLLISSFTAAALMAGFEQAGVMSPAFAMWVSIGGALGVCLILGVLLSFLALKARAEQVILGMALNLLIAGLLPLLCKYWFGTTGQTPTLPLAFRLSHQGPFALGVVILALGTTILFRFTRFGLRLQAAGENPVALTIQGVSVNSIRLKAILLGSAIASLGGVYLSLGSSGYIRNMSAGRGYLALAALIFGRWRPVPTLLACLLFGCAEVVEIRLQTTLALRSFQVPQALIHAIPYLLTLFMLMIFGKDIKAPKAINRQEE